MAIHPMVLGELACGNLVKRAETLRLLGRLPAIPQAPDHLVPPVGQWDRLDRRAFDHRFPALVGSLWMLDRRLAKLV